MNYLSIKELRLGLPRILRRLRRGERFRLVYRARPVGDLTPLQERGGKQRGIYALLASPYGEIHIDPDEDAARLIRSDRE